ncbi:MAG TPA: hypothetical protein VIP51_14705 [Eoetvoesiella sp.]
MSGKIHVLGRRHTAIVDFVAFHAPWLSAGRLSIEFLACLG